VCRTVYVGCNAEWPCNAYLEDGPGELATPHWPLQYDVNVHCTWRISAPAQHRVRLQFTGLDLDRHELGHCTSQLDHVRLLDGGTLSAPVIGFYCGRVEQQLTVLSSGRDMMVQFSSDRHRARRAGTGFHAVFSFQHDNKTEQLIDDSSRYVDISAVQDSHSWNTDQQRQGINQLTVIHLLFDI